MVLTDWSNKKIYLDNGMKLANNKDDFGDPSHEFYSLSQNGKEIDMLGYADDQFFIKREGWSPKKNLAFSENTSM